MAAFQLRAVDRHRVSSDIVDQIVQGVVTGAFPPGQALPAERLLAAQLGVGRSTIREAIRILEHSGVLDVRTGSGTYVSEEGASKASLLRVQAERAGEQSPLDVVAARKALEPVCAELAATKRRRRDLDTLWKNLGEHRDALEHGGEFEEIDMAFHVAVATATQNPVLLGLIEHIVEVMRQATWRDLKHRARSHANGALRYLEHHEAILDAIDGQDPTAAFSAMSKHLDDIAVDLLAEVK